MSLQYITDSSGKTTGVFIPIKEWNKLKSKFKGIEDNDMLITDAQKEEVRKRLKEFENDPSQGIDFYQAMDEIEKDL